MKHIVLLLACLAGMLLTVQAGELYRWVDASGKVNYGDVLPAGAMQVEVKKFPKDTASNEYLPYETLRAQRNFPVTLYVGDGCGEPCSHARGLLNKRGVPFSEKVLKTKSEIDAFQKLSGSTSAPTLQVGKIYLNGFLESAWNNELDIAGYPKTASYRQRIVQPEPSNPEAPETPPAEGQSSEDQTSPPEPAEQ